MNACQLHVNSETNPSKAVEEVHDAARTEQTFVPRVDIVETDTKFVLTADVPGADESSVDIALDKNILKVHAHVASQAPEGYRLGYREYDVGDFERSFTITNEIDRLGIEAMVKDGVLEITLPKSQHAVSQKIPIRNKN